MTDRYIKLQDLKMTPISIEADEVYPGLWMGSAPPVGWTLSMEEFNCLVLCAIEHQVPSMMFPEIKVLYAPNVDDPNRRLSNEQEIETALNTGLEVARRVANGEKVLITCMAGLNRSGLVTGYALHFLTGWSGEDCINRIVERRIPEHGEPLSNSQFVALLRLLPAL